MQQITLEVLAEKLGGKLWSKGDLKRVYLDRGHNTKKMSTKTFVYEKDGEFKVSCKIECDSQPWQWVKSQQEEVIEGVEAQVIHIIRVANATEVFIRIDHDGNYVNCIDRVAPLAELDEDDVFFAKEELENNLQNFTNREYKTISKSEWDARN